MITNLNAQRRPGAGSALGRVLSCVPFWRSDRPAVAPDPDPIAWRDDYGTALEEARAANRLLWIQFTGPWCPNCTRMERESLPHPAVVQHARESFVPLKLRSDVHEQLALSVQPLGPCPPPSSSPPIATSSPFIKATLVRPNSMPFLRDSLSRSPGKPAGMPLSPHPRPRRGPIARPSQTEPSGSRSRVFARSA